MESLQKTYQPTAIQKIGTELAISWSDGLESYFPLEALRRKCPCAACEGERMSPAMS
ncbi:MAG: gamma-butyrobetaine hydroxylase-like domain-containing protein [Terrimicrobiaceae bacterium]